MFWETWSFALEVTLPNVFMMLVGVILRRWHVIDDVFCDVASRVVFNVALPCLLFTSLATNHARLMDHQSLVIYGVLGTLVSFLLLELVALRLVKEPRERGIFVQGGFRANTGVLGLAYAASAYGNKGVAVGSMYLLVTVLLFNILSVITLTRSLQPGRGNTLFSVSMLRNIATNPLIIGLMCGSLYGATGWGLPTVIQKTGDSLSALALPLALLCTGASLNLRAVFGSSSVALYSSLAKVLFVPLFLTAGAWLVGLRGIGLGIIFMFSATPTAAGSYAMTRAMGGNATLAANIIALTTVGSFFTTAVGIFLLRHWGVM